MATKICVPALIPQPKSVIKVKVPTGSTYYQGVVTVAESLYGTTESIYSATPIANIATDEPVIIINQGVYEDANGARPNGYVNPGDFTYLAGDVVTAVRPEKDMLFRITDDCFTGTAVKDQYLIPAVGSTQLAVSSTVSTAIVAFKIEKLITIPVGNTFVSGVLARVKLGR